VVVTLIEFLQRLSVLAPALLEPQASEYIGVNFFVSLTKDGKPLGEDATLTFRGPKGSYKRDGQVLTITFKKGHYWSDYLFFDNQGSGTYQVEALLGILKLIASTVLGASTTLKDTSEDFELAGTVDTIGMK
jgi:hypothetical protein